MSVPWSAPEVIAEQTTGTVASEVWGLGATVYSLLAGRSPFERRESGPEHPRSAPAPHRTRDLSADHAVPMCPTRCRRSSPRRCRAIPPSATPPRCAFAEALRGVQAELGPPPTPLEVAVDEWAAPRPAASTSPTPRLRGPARSPRAPQDADAQGADATAGRRASARRGHRHLGPSRARAPLAVGHRRRGGGRAALAGAVVRAAHRRECSDARGAQLVGRRSPPSPLVAWSSASASSGRGSMRGDAACRLRRCGRCRPARAGGTRGSTPPSTSSTRCARIANPSAVAQAATAPTSSRRVSASSPASTTPSRRSRRRGASPSPLHTGGHDRGRGGGRLRRVPHRLGGGVHRAAVRRRTHPARPAATVRTRPSSPPDAIAVDDAGALYAYSKTRRRVLRYHIGTRVLGRTRVECADDAVRPSPRPAASGSWSTRTRASGWHRGGRGAARDRPGATSPDGRPTARPTRCTSPTRPARPASPPTDRRRARRGSEGQWLAATPGAPVVRDGIVYAAWLRSGRRGTLWRSEPAASASSTAARARRPSPTGLRGSRVARDPQRDAQRLGLDRARPPSCVASSQDWSLDDRADPQSEPRRQAQVVIDPKPPVAEPDAFGVRAGTLVALPVLLNDHDPNEDVLSIDPRES